MVQYCCRIAAKKCKLVKYFYEITFLLGYISMCLHPCKTLCLVVDLSIRFIEYLQFCVAYIVAYIWHQT